MPMTRDSSKKTITHGGTKQHKPHRGITDNNTCVSKPEQAPCESVRLSQGRTDLLGKKFKQCAPLFLITLQEKCKKDIYQCPVGTKKDTAIGVSLNPAVTQVYFWRYLNWNKILPAILSRLSPASNVHHPCWYRNRYVSLRCVFVQPFRIHTVDFPCLFSYSKTGFITASSSIS